MADVNVGNNGVLRMEAWVTGSSAAGNWSNYHWRISLIERTSGSFGWSAGGIAASLEVFWDNNTGYLNPWNGSFGYDFRPGGQQAIVIAEGDLNALGNLPNGAPRTFTFRANMGNSGTSTIGGPASVDQAVAGATTIVVPNAPTNATAARVSDTQATVSWQRNNPSNGQPYSSQVERRVNGGAWSRILDILATTSTQTSIDVNQKVEFRVSEWNSVGYSGYSNITAPIYTTPGAPTNAQAVKNAANDIIVTFTPNVAYTEHNHEVWHGVVAGGVTTWDANPLATLASGVATYTHAAPNANQVHVYRVRSKAGTLFSAYSTTSAVQLLAAPNKPNTLPVPTYSDKALAFTFNWLHNPVDTTPQSAYEFRFSTNGGSTWTTTGKLAGNVQQRVIAANTYAAGVTLTMQVRTWGSATTGGSDGTGASPWSDIQATTFRTRPTVAITSPANGSTVNESTLRVNLSFAQIEAASFVRAELRLSRTTGGTTVLEDLTTTNLIGTQFATPIQNGIAYTVRARVLDSNGIWSNYVTNSFSVTYLAPVPAAVTVGYVESTGYGQLDLSIGNPGTGQSAATLVTITRKIDDGPEEVIIQDYPTSAVLTILDTTPTIHGTNTYTITTTSALGAKSSVTRVLVTEECRRAFLSKGAGFDTVVVFGANLDVSASSSVASAVVSAAGRTKPIGLYGIETSVQLKVKSFIFERETFSTLDELHDFLLLPGKACYRDASGRRLFGSVKGGVSYKKTTQGDLNFTITETS